MNRSLKLSMLMALALGSSQAMALNLGQMQVKSALGQPLRVEIPVIPSSPAELQNLSARLASSDAFARAGITDGKPNMPLQFTITSDHGHKVILVTSSVPVNNPYIDLLIEVSSAAGTSVHEYPVLLDPPGEEMASPTPTPARAKHHEAGSYAATKPAPAVRRTAASALTPGRYGPVKAGQTLSTVARDVAPSGVDIDQMMLALKQANPDAFYRDNINALKAGAVLRVPSREQALAVKIAEAVASVRQQNSDWQNGTPTTVAVAAAQTRESVSPTATSANEDRLALVPAGKGVGSGGGKHESAASLRQELQRSEESLTSLKQQSADLDSRLKALQDINNKNKRLLSLKDSEIADLQAKLAAARKSAGLPAAKSEAATPAKAVPATVGNHGQAATPAVAASSHATVSAPATAASAPGRMAAGPAMAGSAAKPAASAPVAKPVAQKPVAQKPAVHPFHPGPVQPWYMQAWVKIAGAAVLVLALLLLLVSRGRRGKAAAPAAAKVAPSLADRFGDAPAPSAAVDGGDPDQDQLLDELAEHPDDIGLHLELVSLYYSRRDVEHFEAAAEAMHAHITSPQQDEWQDVVHMGEDLTPEHPLFAHGQADAGHHGAFVQPPVEDGHPGEELDTFDLDHYADATEATGPTPPPLRQKVSEYHFDFNLTPPHAPGKAHDDVADADVASRHDGAEPAHDEAPAPSSWHFEEPAEAVESHESHEVHGAHDEPVEPLGDFGELSEDPVDTKLDLARAYLDMGDPEGARAMLDEVMQEGSQMQKDVAKGLLDKLS